MDGALLAFIFTTTTSFYLLPGILAWTTRHELRLILVQMPQLTTYDFGFEYVIIGNFEYMKRLEHTSAIGITSRSLSKKWFCKILAPKGVDLDCVRASNQMSPVGDDCVFVKS
ncbi:hypothetical protein HDK64DRAFT_105598 [Phyllosticta capitalensis]